MAELQLDNNMAAILLSERLFYNLSIRGMH